jgi:hypothetical protein
VRISISILADDDETAGIDCGSGPAAAAAAAGDDDDDKD